MTGTKNLSPALIRGEKSVGGTAIESSLLSSQIDLSRTVMIPKRDDGLILAADHTDYVII